MTPTDDILRVPVTTPSRAYHALIAPALLDRAGHLVREALPAADLCAVVVDAALRTTAWPRLAAALAAANIRAVEIPFEPSEPSKSVDSVERIASALAAHRLERGHPLLALGGGITGDTAGFAAAAYRRGIPWINIPTTLLAMVDASVGGKTGVNLSVSGSLKKNMLGAFWQPTLVLADIDTLASLPPRPFRAGLAECVKHALLSGAFGDSTLFDWTESSAPAIVRKDPAALRELIARNIAVKARVVQGDEREEAPDTDGGRALLNLGHTFAHAIETIPHLSPTGAPADAPLQHGEAVALGLTAALTLAADLRLIPADLPARVARLLTTFSLPTRVANLPPAADILDRMRDDKKVLAGRLRLILPDARLGAWRCAVHGNTDPNRVVAAIDSLRP